MELETKLKVYADLCCEILRNAAYYQAGWKSEKELKNESSDFWRNLNGNFLDVAVLSWCFVFGDERAEFRWQNIIENQDQFLASLLSEIGCDVNDLGEYINCMRLYRDKRVAHRDRYLVGDAAIIYPSMDIAIRSSIFLYSNLYEHYPVIREIYAYSELESFYEGRFSIAEAEYDKAVS